MSKLKPPLQETDHYFGNPASPLQLLEFGDFQCPHCGAAYPILERIKKKYGTRMVFIFRHFPLSKSHPYAQLAAIVSEAAARQGKFWEMYNLIFENQTGMNRQHLFGLAKTLPLDMPRFEKDVADPALSKTVEANFESGIISGVNGTPSFYINGEKYNGPYDFDSLSEALEQRMAFPG